MAQKFAVAETRLFKNVFVCRKCKRTRRTNYQQIKKGKVKCRNCNNKEFRPKSKGKK